MNMNVKPSGERMHSGSAKDFKPQWNASYVSEQYPLIYKSKVK